MNNYFKNIAITHKSILHTEEQPAFFREYSSAKILLSNSDFLVKLRKAKEVVLISQFNGNIRGSGIDNNTADESGSIFLLQRINVTDYAGIDSARINLMEIWNDILSKMKKDIREQNLLLFNFSWQVTPIGAIGDNYYGIAVIMSYKKKLCATYNSDRWN